MSAQYKNYDPSCPRCMMTSVEIMGQTETVVCASCGWTTSRQEIQQENKSDKKFAFRTFMASLIVFAALVHTVIWGEFAREILPLKIKQILSIAAVEDLQRMEKICTLKKRQSCLEVIYMDLVDMDKRDANSAAALGHIRFRHNSLAEAEKLYRLHFERKGRDFKAANQLAQILDSQNKIKEAAHYYELALAIGSDTIQTDLIKNYVAMLARVKRTRDALRVIETVRRKGPVLKYFMAQEFEALKKRKI